jgi:hypothetical protein
MDYETTAAEDAERTRYDSDQYDIWALTPAGLKAAEEAELEEAEAEAAADAAQEALEEAIVTAGYW